MSTKRRRTKGEGSITKLDNNKYRIRLDCGYVNGKRKQLSGTADSLTEARVLLRGFMKLRDEADVAVSMNMTFEALAKNYIEYKQSRSNVKETTLYHYQNHLKVIAPYLATKTISKITTKDIDEFITAMRKQHKAERSIRAYLTLIRIVFNYAIKVLKIVPTSPTEGCLWVATKFPKSDIEVLSEGEFEALRGVLKAAYDTRLEEKPQHKPDAASLLYVAFMIAYETGMRIGEILGLRWSRVDFKNHTIHVDNQRVTLSKGIVDSTPKTASSNRLIVISEGLIEILTKHKASFQFSDKDDYVFSKDFNGTKILAGGTLRACFQRYLLKAGITRHFTFHSLRHTNATKLIELSGNDYKTVSERLGHSSVSITFDVYAHTIKKQHQLAANLMDCTK